MISSPFVAEQVSFTLAIIIDHDIVSKMTKSVFSPWELLT
jgi:hypothetical protein